MKIEIWTDFTCPFCYIGKRKLEIAMEEFPYHEAITLEWVSFPYDIEVNMPIDAILRNRHGYSSAEVKERLQELVMEASALQLPLEVEELVGVNTYDAHRLLQLAKKEDKDNIFLDHLFESYFSSGQLIDDKDVLQDISKAVGLNQQRVDETLSMNCFAKSVAADMQLADDIGIQEVPFYVFEEKYAVEGMQTVESFIDILHDVWEREACESQTLRGNRAKEKEFCTGSECDV